VYYIDGYIAHFNPHNQDPVLNLVEGKKFRTGHVRLAKLRNVAGDGDILVTVMGSS